MDITIFFEWFMRLCFILLGIITLGDYLRIRDYIHLDIALFFGSWMLYALISLIQDLIVPIPVLGKIGTIMLLAHPYLLLRLVRHFRSVSTMVHHLSLIGLLISSSLVIGFEERPPLMTIFMVIYVVLLEIYCTQAFVQDMRKKSGVSGWRLRLAALGSLLLVILFGLLFVLLLLPIDIALNYLGLLMFVASLTALSYYLAFATPRWLWQTWQYAELHNFIQVNFTSDEQNRYVTLAEYVERSIDAHLAFVAQWNEDSWHILSEPTEEIQNMLPSLPPGETLDTAQYLTSDSSNNQQNDETFSFFIVPVKSNEHLWGYLFTLVKHGRLFSADDLNLLERYAEQIGLLLDNERLVDTQKQLIQQLQQTVKEQQEAENHVRTLNEELEKRVQDRTEELNAMNEELEAFAYTVSHDLRAPLRALNNYSRFLQEDCNTDLEDDCLEYLDGIAESATDMENLVVDLLEYTRVARTETIITLVDVKELVESILDQVKTVGDTDVILPEESFSVESRELLLRQIFSNLITNALKFKRPDVPPRIEITWAKKSDDWTFSIRDNGIGIHEKYNEQIFGMFQRLHLSDEFEGTGIGLAIVKKAIDTLHGTIRLESVVGEGTSFTISLPYESA